MPRSPKREPDNIGAALQKAAIGPEDAVALGGTMPKQLASSASKSSD
jgi:hypothetical protein